MAFNSYMHERNIYRNKPDFTQLALDNPVFRKYAVPDATGKKVHVDFSNPDALRMVTEILLKKDFNLDVVIPQGYLIPTVPQRLNYILWLEDLLHYIPRKKKILFGIDIGTGPCAIFSILGAGKNNWNFIATETSDDAIEWAKKNIAKNSLEDNIKVVKVSPSTTLTEVLSSNEENYDFCLCNPPFFGNTEEIRKKHPTLKGTIADVAQKEEIFFEGGELNFVKSILSDSLIYKDRISLFTSMFGKKKSFLQILKEIKELSDAKVTTTEFCQGNTIRWGIAWTFNRTVQFEKVERKIKPKKTKPPLEYQIPLKGWNLRILAKRTESFLRSLLIPVTVTRSSQGFVELLLKSDSNTWIHQRRKRREMQRQGKEAKNVESEDTRVRVTGADSEAIPSPKTSADINRSETGREGGATFVDIGTSGLLERGKGNSEIVLPENATDCNEKTSGENGEPRRPRSAAVLEITSSTADLVNGQDVPTKRKEFFRDSSSVNKKSRLDPSLKKKDSSYSEECTGLSLESRGTGVLETTEMEPNNKEVSSHTNETESLTFEDSKWGEIDEYKSHLSNDSETTVDSKNLQNKTDCIETLSGHATGKLQSEVGVESSSSQQGSVLHCHLQMIKGKNKIYVKMNCPTSADRNTMYQVFQLVKNKIK